MFKLPDLPYAYEALQPVISSDTMHLHHDKHHAKYVDTTNQILDQAGQKPQSLEDVVRTAAGDGKARKLFNNAAQSWNHAFFWEAMAPTGGEPSGALAAAIQSDFGGLPGLKNAFVTEGVGHFGSGWVWLADDGSRLSVLSTHDGENLLTREGVTPLIVCDLWEHAYYLDHQSNRQGFLEAWFDKLANWRFAESQLAAGRGGGQAWRYPAPNA